MHTVELIVILILAIAVIIVGLALKKSRSLQIGSSAPHRAAQGRRMRESETGVASHEYYQNVPKDQASGYVQRHDSRTSRWNAEEELSEVPPQYSPASRQAKMHSGSDHTRDNSVQMDALGKQLVALQKQVTSLQQQVAEVPRALDRYLQGQDPAPAHTALARTRPPIAAEITPPEEWE